MFWYKHYKWIININDARTVWTQRMWPHKLNNFKSDDHLSPKDNKEDNF